MPETSAFLWMARMPQMSQLDLSRMKPEFYTGNHHKWLCGPKTSGFLYVQPELQHQVKPNVISHSANRPRPKRSRFISEFDWTGTYDPSPLLAVPAALDFMRNLYPGGLVELLKRTASIAGERFFVMLWQWNHQALTVHRFYHYPHQCRPVLQAR